MLEIDITDVIGVLRLCIPYFIGLAIFLVLVIAAMIFAKKFSAQKKYLVRREGVVAMVLSVIIVLNLIVLGPMSVIIGLATGNGTVTQESADEATALAEEIAAEGIVLLENDGLLPLTDTQNINLFGWASSSPVYGGSGSGAINDLWPIVSMEQGFTNAGFTFNTELSDFYKAYAAKRPSLGISEQDWTLPEPPVDTYSQDMINNAKNFSDTAVVVISRMGGEAYQDLPKNVSEVAYTNNSANYEDFPNGNHYLELSQTELNLVEMVSQNFSNVVLVYNSAHAFELNFVKDYPQIKSVLWVPGTGNVGFNALGKIVRGEINPSGKTSDTFIYDMTAAPWWETFAAILYDNMDDLIVEAQMTATVTWTLKPSFINYNEGIYVGYKFYETAAAEGLLDYDTAVQYPFGYGKSYTTFSQTMSDLRQEGDMINFDVTVTNTGAVAGKEVVEVYYNPPYTNGGIEKSVANLLTFEKTDLLEPGASQTFNFSFNQEDMASFDEKGTGGYVLEQGDYIISINSDSHNIIASKTFNLPQTIVYNESNPRSTDLVAATAQFDYAAGDVIYLSRANGFENFAQSVAAPASNSMSEEYKAGYFTNKNYDASANFNNDEPMPTTGAPKQLVLADLRGAEYDDPRWEQLLDQMSVEDMSSLTAMAGFQTLQISSIDKLSTIDCDGPAAINNNFTGTGSVGFPVAVMIACTWNQQLALDFGESIGTMADEMNVSGWYAPAMNTHRSPFGGRNFEYYSEDATLAAQIAANAVQGAKNKGVYAYIKHFAMYDSNAMMVSAWSNEQAMREVYFKPFEACIKESDAGAMMVAWSFIGNRWCGASSNLLQTVLRDEWGFTGFTLTDSFGNDGRGFMNADIGLFSGIDAFLSNYDAGNNILSNKTDSSSVIALRDASKHILYTVANSRVYDSENVNVSMPTWQIIVIVVDVILAALLILWAVVIVKKSKKLENSSKDKIVSEK